MPATSRRRKRAPSAARNTTKKARTKKQPAATAAHAADTGEDTEGDTPTRGTQTPASDGGTEGDPDIVEIITDTDDAEDAETQLGE